MKTTRWGYVALVVVIALVTLWGCQEITPEEPEARSYNTPCYQEQGGGRWVCGDGGTLAVLDGGTLDVAGDADFTGATITGIAPSALESDVTITGNLVVSGTTLSVGAISGDLTGNVTGDVTGEVTGNLIGYAYYGRPIAVSANYTATQSESGATLLNFGATGEIMITLPDVSLSTVGYRYCFYVYSAYTMTIVPFAGDQIHALTNAAGDRVQNVGTLGDSLCLLNITSADWVPMQEVGTWSDVD